VVLFIYTYFVPLAILLFSSSSSLFASSFRRRMIWLLSPVSKFFLFLGLCVAGQAYYRNEGGGGGEPEQKAWSSINHSKLPILTSTLFSLTPFSVPYFWPHSISPPSFPVSLSPPFSGCIFRTYPITRGQLVKWWVGWD
jgi:hypothetical protein